MVVASLVFVAQGDSGGGLPGQAKPVRTVGSAFLGPQGASQASKEKAGWGPPFGENAAVMPGPILPEPALQAVGTLPMGAKLQSVQPRTDEYVRNDLERFSPSLGIFERPAVYDFFFNSQLSGVAKRIPPLLFPGLPLKERARRRF